MRSSTVLYCCHVCTYVYHITGVSVAVRLIVEPVAGCKRFTLLALKRQRLAVSLRCLTSTHGHTETYAAQVGQVMVLEYAVCLQYLDLSNLT